MESKQYFDCNQASECIAIIQRFMELYYFHYLWCVEVLRVLFDAIDASDFYTLLSQILFIMIGIMGMAITFNLGIVLLFIIGCIRIKDILLFIIAPTVAFILLCLTLVVLLCIKLFNFVQSGCYVMCSELAGIIDNYMPDIEWSFSIGSLLDNLEMSMVLCAILVFGLLCEVSYLI